tara:strand:+ start:180 stop:1226 length:1047 start_codon:yes stop_codon:yes gene_type:complete
MFIIIRILLGIYLLSCFACENHKKDSGYFNKLIIDAIEMSSSSVVGIIIESNISSNNKKNGFASGLAITNDGYIVTNAHVVGDADKITITTIGGNKYLAEIIGLDILTDIALIKIEANNLNPAILGDSKALDRGEWVIALGNPYNLFSVSKKPTSTIGIISGNNVNFGLKESGHVYQNMIQTDASINPGNSGGPLINLEGEVIGINTFIVSESKSSGGIGFSIPIDRVKSIIYDLIEFGKIDRTWITGITVRPLNDTIKKYFKIEVDKGVVVSDVERKSEGEIAGIKLKDVIYKVNNQIISSGNDIEEVLNEGYFKTGDEVEILVIRNGKIIKTKLKLIDPHDENQGK